MSKYVRTDKEIIYVGDLIKDEYGNYCNPKNYETDMEVSNEYIIKEADTIKELCDVFKNVNVYAGTISFTNYINFELARFNKSEEATLYGYIYIILPNGAVRIEPVAKMNEKGCLELL